MPQSHTAKPSDFYGLQKYPQKYPQTGPTAPLVYRPPTREEH
ncbi:conserved protein of unknown function [Ralstonia solanacearum CFBP2957]|nr:conserved protein of unknown function [Ralstonia solanacearum CFBP2957]